MYQKQIEQLVVLQVVDDEIIILEEEVRKAPEELADLEGRLNSLSARKAQIDEKVEMLSTQLKRLDGEIEDDSSRIKKSKNKLMMVGNTKEYHAMMREMDGLEKLNRLREEERIALTEELERQQEFLKELDGEVAVVHGEYDAKKSTLDARVAEAQTRLDVLNTRRSKAADVVPKPILGRYEFIRSRLSHPVIVAVADGICTGCNIRIPPQIYNDLQKGQQIIGCPNCQRLVFWSEHIPDAVPARPRSQAPVMDADADQDEE